MAKKKSNSSADSIRQYLAEIGKKGGQAGTGKAKARDPEPIRQGQLKRWAKYRENQANEAKRTDEKL
jgi:hypothetical protein